MLPQVIPMLAVAAQPFDSPEYCFEIKYDGVLPQTQPAVRCGHP